MQKKIIALAIAAAFSAPAMAEVTVYGVVDAGVAIVSGDGLQGDMLAIAGGLSGSRLGVTAVEDVAYGMKAVAKVEYALDPSTNGGIGNARQEMLALAGDFGTVATGYLQTTGYDWAVKFDPTSGSAVSPLQAVTSAGGFYIGSAAAAARAPRAVAYISPDFGGITVAANYTTDYNGGTGDAANASGTETKTTAMLFSATYTAGPLAVGGVYLDASVGGSSAWTEFSIGGSYDLGMAKLFGTFQSGENAAGNGGTAMSFGAVAPVGAGAVAGSFASTSLDAANSNSNGFTVAYLQGLSKTTTAYVAYNSYSNDSTGAGVGGGSVIIPTNALGGVKNSSLIAVGLNKKF